MSLATAASDRIDVAAETWDAIVVGTGMGGATLGYALAKLGWRILFCEKGLARGADELSGRYAESFFESPAFPGTEHADILRRAGRYAEPIEDRSKSSPIIPFLGCGAGGSSAIYGMAMERFFPADFTPAKGHPNVAGVSLPDEWPVCYDELAPHYAAAERLYRVRGGRDPLRADTANLEPAPPLTAAAAVLAGHLEARGMHPYRLPSACEYVEGCRSCQGYLCPKDCKNDSVRACLNPAIIQYGAALVDDCEVIRLRASKRTVDAVECRMDGRPITLRGRIVVVAAGALATPVLLQKSASRDWPDGLANDSGLVGRNLMRHLLDLYAIKPPDGCDSDNRIKELAFNDFYLCDGAKLGTVQSFGQLPPVDVVQQSMLHDIRNSRFHWASSVARSALPVMRAHIDRLIDRRLILATTLEDLPHADNRVLSSGSAGSGIAMRYEIGAYERARLAQFRKAVGTALKPLRFWRLAQADRNERIAHACGTCRFGDNPRTSVLDRDCRAHGLDNLYIVDSSFFPTSGGTNPSLTIAANALRVACALTGTTPQ